MARPKKAEPTRAQRNIAWIEQYCRTPDGEFVGKPIKLRNWQRDLLVLIYDNPAITRQAIISMPRKNGKTALISFMLLLHLCGPEARMNSQLYSAAQSREQAATVFKLAAKVVRQSPDLNAVVVIRDTAKELLCPEIGTFYAALSADKSTAHGKSPVFAVHDELGQVKGPTSELYDAVETGMGAHRNPLSVVISTQAPTDNDILSRLIDRAEATKSDRTVLKLFSAPMDADPFSLETLKACNPAWGDFLNEEEVIEQMEKAKEMPSQEASYRNLHLNQRVDMNTPFVAKSVWRKNGDDVSENWGEAPVYAGLDLSSTADLTAFVPIAQIDGKWETKPTFWLPGDGLKEKARNDRVPYDQWASEGYLQTSPGRSVEYQFVARWLFDFCQANNVRKIAFDRWGMKYLRPWLLEAGFTEERIDELFEEVGSSRVDLQACKLEYSIVSPK